MHAVCAQSDSHRYYLAPQRSLATLTSVDELQTGSSPAPEQPSANRPPPQLLVPSLSCVILFPTFHWLLAVFFTASSITYNPIPASTGRSLVSFPHFADTIGYLGLA